MSFTKMSNINKLDENVVFLRRDGTNSAAANINLNSNKLINIIDPTD